MKKIAWLFSICLLSFTVYVMLDTFVLSDSYEEIVVKKKEVKVEHKETEVTQTDDYYKDENIEIKLTKDRKHKTDIYIADVKINNPELLQTAFAKDTYGKNIVAKTSVIAKDHNAILAINGDYYGVHRDGFVVKDGIVYRDIVRKNQEDLLIYKDGSFELLKESDTELSMIDGLKDVLAFGPGLVEDGEVVVGKREEVKRARVTNPRTAIGIIGKNHYVFVVSDGRTRKSSGLSLYELGDYMKDLGCKIAYNLDGGGSSTMIFNNKIINTPTHDGYNIKERKVSDIVYIGY